MAEISYCRHRFPPAIIQDAVWVYLRFTLSYRDVEELLAEPSVRAERMRVIPMRRPGEVDEVAYAVLFLASDESSYITGSEIHVDRGAIAI